MAEERPNPRLSLQIAANRAREGNPGARLKSETRLITHGDAIEHVTWRSPATAGVSLGALIKVTKRLRPENPRGYRRRKRPFAFSIRRLR